MESFVFFLGRFHVLVLHLPIGILTLAVVFECLVRWRPFRFLTPALPWTWLAGGVAGVGTVILGFMHATESGFQDSPAVEAHRLAGITLTAAAFLFWILRLRLPQTTATVWPAWAKSARLDAAYAAAQPYWAEGGRIDKFYDRAGWIVACVVTFVMMSVTGHLGGNLTHGETYLVQYAPKPLRRLAGLSSETDPRPTPKDLASADIYLDIVAPALHARCDACHNDGKKSGGLSIANYDALMKGGKVGAVIVPGDAAKSNLFHRVTLPSNNADFMPKDGKTPLTAEQTAAVGVWIAAGAPKSGLVGTLKLSDAQKATLQKALGAGAGGGEGGDSDDDGAPVGAKAAPLPVVAPADPAVVAALEKTGFIVRRVASKSNLVSVNFTAPRQLNAEDLANLAKLAPQIRTLNLRRSGLTDSQIQGFAAFTNLSSLRLQDDPVTDAGLSVLIGLKQLNDLTLVGTKATDAGLDKLAAMPSLKGLYVWGSAITPAAAERLKAGRKDLVVVTGVKPEDIAPNGPIVPPAN
jgi:uncharacterized membrane protein